MMTMYGAIEYGKRIGVKYYVKNTHGGLYGGYITLKDAQEAKKKFEKEDKSNPFTKGTTKFIITKA